MQRRGWVGAPYRTREGFRYVTGTGRFIDDMSLPGMLFASILRSPHAHASIKTVDVTRALKRPGVRAVLTGAELAHLVKPFRHLIPVPDYYSMAVDRVRYIGEPVAALVTEDRLSAEDSLELIDVDYELLQPVLDAEKAMEPAAPLLHKGFESNVAWHRTFHYGDIEEAFSRADTVVSERLYFHRYASTPLETTSCIANYDPGTQRLTIWDHNHQVGLYRSRVPEVLNVPEHRVRHITPPDIGGSFGNKIMVYPYSVIVALLSMKVRRPVKWIADRREDMQGLAHSPDRIAQVEAALKRDGNVLGLRNKIIDNFGAYLRHPEPQNITRPFMTFLGCYRIKHVSIDAYGVFTNKCPTGPNRGYGCQHTAFMVERMMDRAARKLGIDLAEIRLRNMIQSGEMPYTTPFGCVYDGGDYPRALRRALELVDYGRLREQQGSKDGSYLGIGVGAIVEPGATNASVAALWGSPIKDRYASTSEAALVTIHPTGKVTVAMGTAPHGQGHETVAAQIVADQLGISPDDVEVLGGFDSFTHPFGGDSGTYASRFAVMGVGALLGACSKLRDRVLRIAAKRLGCNPRDIILSDGNAKLRNMPGKEISLREVARIAYHQLGLLPQGIEPGLASVHVYHFPHTTSADKDLKANYSASYAYAAGCAVVEVDAEVGEVKVLRLVLVHDAGVIINPLILEGQIHGAAAHGLGGARYEELIYNEQGQLLSSTFADYSAPTAVEVPTIEVEHIETPSSFTPLGSKGSGEGVSILLPALIAGAVEDALVTAGIGASISELPVTPERIWRKIRARLSSS